MPFSTFDEWEPTRGPETAAIETHYMTLPGNADDIIRQLLGSSTATETHNIDQIFKPDSETVEVVYYNNADAEVVRETYGGEKEWNVTGTELPQKVHTTVENLLQSYFGPAWLVGRKPDKREYTGRSRQRLWIRRVTYTDFRYTDESYEDARKIIEGVDVEADTFGEMDLYPQPPKPIRTTWARGDDDSPPEERPLDLYVYRTGSGTAHLLRGADFRNTAVMDDPECLCGRHIPAEDARDGDVHHFADYVNRFDWAFEDDGLVDDIGTVMDTHPDTHISYNPVQVLRDDLCVACRKDFCDVRRSSFTGRIRNYRTPDVNYRPLLDWPTIRVDELDWTPTPTEKQADVFVGADL